MNTPETIYEALRADGALLNDDDIDQAVMRVCFPGMAWWDYAAIAPQLTAAIWLAMNTDRAELLNRVTGTRSDSA